MVSHAIHAFKAACAQELLLSKRFMHVTAALHQLLSLLRI
jgi:hypothetical protein